MRPSIFLRVDRTPSENLRSMKSLTIPSGTSISIDAGEAAERGSLDDEGVLERSRVVLGSAAHARMPYVGLRGKYNKRWWVDVVTLPHNALRALLSKTFSAVTAVRRLALDMTIEDYEKLFIFLSQVNRFAHVVLEAEDKILFPFVENGLKRSIPGYSETHALYPVTRGVRKIRLLSIITKLIEYGTNVTRSMAFHVERNGGGKMGERDGRIDEELQQQSVELAAYIHKQVDAFTAALLDYFDLKESELPKFVARSVRGARERTRMERLLIKFFADIQDEFFLAAVLAIPLTVPKVREDFIRRHFSSKKRRRLFLDAVRQVDETFIGVADAFELAASKYQSRFSVEEFLTHYGAGEDDEINEAENDNETNDNENNEDGDEEDEFADIAGSVDVIDGSRGDSGEL